MRWPFARGGRARSRVFVLSLDGVGHAFLARHLPEGAFPQLARLFAQGDLQPLRTVPAPSSATVWATYMTGRNPGRHGIYGLVERRPGSYELYAPTSRDVGAPALWDVLGRAGRRAVVVNVPMTHPPRPICGVLVSCAAIGPLDGLVYPRALGGFLRGVGYRPDVDLGTAPDGTKEDLLESLRLTLRRRFDTAFSLLQREPWDLFQLHLTETDRINHLFWRDYERDTADYGRAFLGFYRELDTLVGALLAHVPEEAQVVLLSGHGFCELRREVHLNRCLEEHGWLEFEGNGGRRLGDISPDAKAYCLPGGRVYLHLKGREPRGRIHGREEYRSFREGIAADLLRLRDPESGEEVMEAVLPGERAHRNPAWGEFPLTASGLGPAPCDLLAVPREGYALKGHLDRQHVFGRGELSGAHAGDGFVFLRGRRVRARAPAVPDLFPTILEMMGVARDEELDGTSLL